MSEKIIQTRECVQAWVQRTYELNKPMEVEDFYATLGTKESKLNIKKVQSKWESEDLRVIAVELPGEVVEVESDFDWKLSDYSDQKVLFDKVVRRMQRGICHFSFEMVSNGQTKVAFGTMSPRALPADKAKTPVSISPQMTIPQVYWDLEAQDWRSFLPTHLITTV